MTFAPPTLTRLMAYWVAQGGVNLGIVGDAAHQARATYHNGKDVIDNYGRTAATDYSIRLPRDRAGLTNAAAAVDLGKLDGSLDKERAFARWFAGQCYADVPGYRAQVREVIFWSTVRGLVLGWSSLAPDKWIENYGDGSHEWHCHISWFRDTESREKVALFSRYPLFAPPPPLPGDDMPVFKTYATPKLVTLAKGDWIYVKPDLSANTGNIQIDPGRDLPVSGVLSDGTLIVGYRDATPTEPIVPTYYAKGTAKDYPPPPPPDCAPAIAADRAKAYVAYKP